MTTRFGNGGVTVGHSSPMFGARIMDASAEVLYINSNIGADAASRGRSRNDPFATLAYAVSSMAGTDDVTFVVCQGHVERLTDFINVGNRCAIIGEGTGDSRPSIRQGKANAGVIEFANGSAYSSIHGIIFDKSTDYRHGVYNLYTYQGVIGISITNCDFLIGDYDVTSGTVYGAYLGASSMLDGCTFKAVYSPTIASPYLPIGVECYETTANIFMNNCVFDGGSVGWNTTNGHAFEFDVATLNGTGNVLVNGAGGLVSSTTKGILTVKQAGLGGIDWQV